VRVRLSPSAPISAVNEPKYKDWVEKHTVGFPELAARAAEFTPDYVEEVTGVPAGDVARFAREFASIQPSVIRLGVALERHAGGGQTIRAVCAIPALTGSWRHVSGGLLQMPLWEFPIDWARVSRPDFIRPGTRVVNNLQLGRALVGDMKLDPPIMGLYIYNTNPVSQAPETNKIVQGLRREDLFFVTAEHFLTDTAAYADIFLPATMAGERDDMMFSWPLLPDHQREGDFAARRSQVECRDLPPARGSPRLR
jgi:anaerobic selenocysteine-containing dehydrogenase